MPETVTDATLLERFVRFREEDAFVALVRRHKPAVLAVCRRFLRSEHDIEDVFQSTFLVLALKASRITWQDSIEGWLRNVARRLALHARTRAVKRRIRERSIVVGEEPALGGTARVHIDQDPCKLSEQNDLRQVLVEALEQLPEKYRAPVMLCYMEGKTNEEAARQLGWPAGSMSRRLERGRSLLRSRLANQGFTLVVGVLLGGFLLLQGVHPAARSRFTNRDSTGSIRQAMSPFARQSEGGQKFESVLHRIASGSALPQDQARIEDLADVAVQAAERIVDHNPGSARVLWRAASIEMKSSAIALAQAARAGDGPAMLGSARRLDATCVRCHEWFRADRSSDRDFDRLGVWSASRLLDKMN